MILGPRYGICPYQPAGGLSKPIDEKKMFKINEKVPKKVKKGDNFQQGMDSVTSYVVY